MKANGLFRRWRRPFDLGVFLKFYGRLLFSLAAAIFVITVMIQSFMVAPGWTIVATIFVLSLFAWILGEILTTHPESD